MSDRHDLSARDALDVCHERGHILSPLRPSVNVPASARALAVAAEIHCKGPEPIPGHSLRETLVPSRVVAKSVHDGKRQLSTGFGPRSVREPGSVGGLDGPLASESTLSRQGARSLSGS